MNETAELPDTGATPPGAPLWVKVSAILAAVVVLVVVALLLTGSGHGPGRHLPGGEEHRPAVDHGVPHP